MIRNADISYSSIAANERNKRNECLCCFCNVHCSPKSCCKCCILRLPFGTITATLIAICGLVITITSLMQSTVISDRIFYDLLQRKHYWFTDLKVIYVIMAIAISVVIFVNLMIGFATTGRHSSPGKLRRCFCNPGSASSCVIKSVFVINYILYHSLLICSLILCVSLFVCYVVSRLCHEERTNHSELEQRIDLKMFYFFLSVRQNETELLNFTGNRLKMLCTDFMSSLTVYVMLSTLGFILLTVAFMNYLINLSVNWVRVSTKQKCAELMYINSAEMTAFGDGNVDSGSRY